MKLKSLLPWLFCVLLTGCGSSGLTSGSPKMEVELVNQSSQALENALVRFGDHDCEWGYVGKTFTKSYMFYPHPITVKTELHWDEGVKHRVENLDLSKIYVPGKPGRLTFTVHDGRVEVSFREILPAK